MIWIVCPHCKKPSEVDERTTGGVVPCPKCGLGLQLPTVAPPSIAVSPAASSIAIPDEDEATMRVELPDAFFAGTEALGRPRFRVESGFQMKGADTPGTWFLLLGLAAVALGLFSVFRIKDYFVDRKEHFAPGAGFPLLNLFAVVVGLPGGLWLCRAGVRVYLEIRREEKTYAVVWTEGFVHYDGRRFILWRWADIAALNMQAIDQRTLVVFVVLVTETSRQFTKYYRLRHRDGTAYQFWSTQGSRAAQFGFQVEQETHRLMWPDAVTRLNAGQPVRFDPFEIRPTGLVYREQFTSWDRIESARFEKGSLRLDGMGPDRGKVTVLLKKIDNHHVFLALLKQKVGFEDED